MVRVLGIFFGVLTLWNAAWAGAHIEVYLLPDCPVMEDALPSFRAKASRTVVRLRLVVIAPDTDASRKRWQTDFPNAEVIWDPTGSLARDAGFDRTPAARVWNSNQQIVYRGALASAADEKGEVQLFALDALDDILKGRPVRVAERPVIGCLLPPPEEVPQMPPAHIRAAIRSVCLPCHVPGGHAPFALNTDADIARWLPMIHEVVSSRKMPPSTSLWPGSDVFLRWNDPGANLSSLVSSALATDEAYWQQVEPWPAPIRPPLDSRTMAWVIGFSGTPEPSGLLRRWTAERRWELARRSYAGLWVWPDGRRDLRHVRAWVLRNGERVGFLGEWTPGRASSWPEGFAQELLPGDRIAVEYWTREGWNASGKTFRMGLIPGEGRPIRTAHLARHHNIFELTALTGQDVVGVMLAPSGWSPLLSLATAKPGHPMLAALGAVAPRNWPLVIWLGGPALQGPLRLNVSLSMTQVENEGQKYGSSSIRYGPLPDSLWAVLAESESSTASTSPLFAQP